MFHDLIHRLEKTETPAAEAVAPAAPAETTAPDAPAATTTVPTIETATAVPTTAVPTPAAAPAIPAREMVAIPAAAPVSDVKVDV